MHPTLPVLRLEKNLIELDIVLYQPLLDELTELVNLPVSGKEVGGISQPMR